MTPEELRATLEALTPEQKQMIYEQVGTGGSDTTVDGRVRHFVYNNDKAKLEEIYVFRLNKAFGLNLKTEAEKRTALEARAADAAERSATAAQASAKSAADSVTESQNARRVSTIALVVAVVSLALQAMFYLGCPNRWDAGARPPNLQR